MKKYISKKKKKKRTPSPQTGEAFTLVTLRTG